MKSFRTMAVLAALLAAAPVFAQPYVFVGYSSIEGNAGIQIGGGYNFSPHFGAEASFVKPKWFSDETTPVSAGSTQTKVDGSMISLAAIGRYPMGTWAIIGKLSANYIDADVTATTTLSSLSPTPGVTTTSRSSKDWALGFGGGVELGKPGDKWGARLLYERIEKTDELGKLDHVQLQGVYRF